MSDDLAKLNIPTPKNRQPGDNSFEQMKSSTMGQKLAYEPPAELVDLPSHGLLYNSQDKDIQAGKILIRPMTVHEEKIISTPRLVKSGQALDMIFKNVIKSQIDPSDLLSSDRVFLMLWLRSISYGNKYEFKLQCPSQNCQRRFKYTVDLEKHPIKEMDESIGQEPFNITLPSSKAEVQYRLARGKDEAEIIKLNNQPKAIDDADEAVVKRLSSSILSIKLPNGVELKDTQKDAFVESMIGRDASTLRQEIEKIDSGVEDIKNITCPYCAYEFDTSIPITESFFRT